LNFPQRCQFFLDPYRTIFHYKTCQLNPARSRLQSLSLSTVYEYINGSPLEDAHNSLADCQAQADVLFDLRFRDFWDKPKSIVLVEDVWDNKIKKRAKQDQEKRRQVHSAWKADAEAATWEIPRAVNYQSASGGGVMGPTSHAMLACRGPKPSLANVFTQILTMNLIVCIAQQSNKYANEDFVVPVLHEQPESAESKRRTKHYRSCGKNDDGATH